MNLHQHLKSSFPSLNPELIAAFAHDGTFASYAQGTELLREGQYVKVIPVVITGSVKVMADFEDRELLLYHIRPSQSCAMSFSAILQNAPSKIKAITEKDSEILLLPSEAVVRWTNDYPEFNKLFFDQYQMRYGELLQTIESLLFGKMDQRLHEYLKDKAQAHAGNPFRKTHREIAQDLGTAREVVSRVIKKLENEGKIEQGKAGIKVLS